MLSSREAIKHLHSSTEPPLTTRLAQGLLVSGLAGPAERMGQARCYPEYRIAQLAATPPVDLSSPPAECVGGVLVIRAAAERGLALRAPEDRRGHGSSSLWISPFIRVRLAMMAQMKGPLPVVGTIASYVVWTAEYAGSVSNTPGRNARSALLLAPSGEWRHWAEGHRFHTPPGNNWHLWHLDPRHPATLDG